MQLGVTLPSATGDAWRVPPARLKDYAQRAESFGFGGLWAFDHLAPSPIYNCGALLDPLVTLATVASVTERIPIGTDILILPLRHPVPLAHQLGSLQYLAEGRLVFGAGTGYVREEFEAVGVPHEERSPRTSEALELITRLFREDRVSFSGEFFELEDFRLAPSTPRSPEVLAGGGGVDDGEGGRLVREAVRDRIARADGWIAPPYAPEVVGEDWSLIAEDLRERGQDPAEKTRCAINYTHLEPSSDPGRVEAKQSRALAQLYADRYMEPYGMELQAWARQNALLGTVDEIRDQLRRYEELGMDQVMLFPLARGLDVIDRQLDLWKEYLLPVVQ